jgi:hypothetical protein
MGDAARNFGKHKCRMDCRDCSINLPPAGWRRRGQSGRTWRRIWRIETR